jgi:predicted metalloprotease with PDZ domain
MSITRFIAFTLLFFCFRIGAQTLPADNSYHISIDLQNVTPDKDRVKITIVPPPIKARTIKYVLPAFLPGVAGRVDAGRFIHQFYALDDKGYPLKVSKKGDNTIILKMRKGATLKKIEYWVDDTWDAEKIKPRQSADQFNYVPQVAGTNIDAGNNYVLNHAFLFGYIEGFSEVPYMITIIKPEDLSGSSALKIKTESQTRDVYSSSSYKELLDNPVMYSRADTIGFYAGDIYVQISVFSENGRISARLVRRLIATGVIASANFVPEIGARNYKMIFYFTTPFKTMLNSNGAYGGLAHRNCAFYFLPELADEDALANELQRETSGDILHLLAPLDYQSVCCNNDFLKPQISRSWWFSEGVNLYFGWLAGIRDSTISENEFMGAVSSKIRLAQLSPAKPVTDVNLLSGWLKIPLRREAMRARAMLLALMLDIKITELSNGKSGLREAVLAMNEHQQIYPDSLETWLMRASGVDLSQFFRDYVDGVKTIPLSENFDKIGWAYASATVDSILTFGQFGLLYNDNLDAFFVYNADTTNLFGLRDGDRIVSVNGTIVGSSNFDEALHSVYTPTKNDEVELHFIRGDQNYSCKAIPTVRAIVVEYLIRQDPAASKAAIKLHNRIFSAGTNW